MRVYFFERFMNNHVEYFALGRNLKKMSGSFAARMMSLPFKLFRIETGKNSVYKGFALLFYLGPVLP